MSGAPLLQGANSVTGVKVAEAHKRCMVFRSTGALVAASPVMANTTVSTPYGAGVTLLTSTNDHAIIGMFEGGAGSGASGATFVAGTTTSVSEYYGASLVAGAKAAVTNDAIEVTLEGPVVVRARMSATNAGTLTTTSAALQAMLGASAIDGVFQTQTLPAAGISAHVVLHSAGTLTDTTLTEFVRAYILP